MAEDLEDDDFRELVAERQHKELIGSLKSLMNAIEKMELSDKSVNKSIQEQSNNIAAAISKISNQKPIEIPKMPDININQDAVIEELKTLSACVTELNKSLNTKKPIEWEFTIDRGYNGRAEKITAKPKNS